MEDRIFETNNLLILGNGFDLSLGLPTSYSDFIGSKIFEDLLFQGNELALKLDKRNHLDGWIDVEAYLAELGAPTKDYATYESIRSKSFFSDFFIEFKEIKEALCKYLNGLDYSLIDRNLPSVRLLRTLLKRERLQIVNFNYTPTVDILLEGTSFKYEQIHVHGAAANKGIVFGIEDSAKIETQLNFLRKSISSHLWADSLISDLMSNVNDSVTIFGHSLGRSDHTQFKDFFGSDSAYCNLNIHYHTEPSYLDLFRQIESMAVFGIQRFRTQHKKVSFLGPPISF